MVHSPTQEDNPYKSKLLSMSIISHPNSSFQRDWSRTSKVFRLTFTIKARRQRAHNFWYSSLGICIAGETTLTSSSYLKRSSATNFSHPSPSYYASSSPSPVYTKPFHKDFWTAFTYVPLVGTASFSPIHPLRQRGPILLAALVFFHTLMQLDKSWTESMTSSLPVIFSYSIFLFL